MRTASQVRLFALFSVLWSLWHVLFWEVKQLHSFVADDQLVPQGYHEFAGRARKGAAVELSARSQALEKVGPQKVGEIQLPAKKIAEAIQNRRQNLKSDVRKRRRTKKRVTRKQNYINKDTEIGTRELTTSTTHTHPTNSGPSEQLWIDHRSNALPEFQEGIPVLTRLERIKGPTPKRHSLVFLHLGKAAGRTIQQTFKAGCYAFHGQRRRRSCLARLQQVEETMLSRSVKTRMHCDRIGPVKDISTATAFLWSTRDPIDRIVSWYDYTNPANCLEKEVMAVNCQVDRYYRDGWVHDFFKKCFENAESFIASLEDPSVSSKVETTTGIPCNQLAWMGVLGLAPPDESSHLHFNYEFYRNATAPIYPDKEIMVVRTEFLWEDLTDVEHLLGGNAVFNSSIYGIDGTHGSHDYPHKTVLSPESQAILCCAVQGEVAIYIDLINRATNLNAAKRAESLNSLAVKCDVPNLDMLPAACEQTLGRSYSEATTALNGMKH